MTENFVIWRKLRNSSYNCYKTTLIVCRILMYAYFFRNTIYSYQFSSFDTNQLWTNNDYFQVFWRFVYVLNSNSAVLLRIDRVCDTSGTFWKLFTNTVKCWVYPYYTFMSRAHSTPRLQSAEYGQCDVFQPKQNLSCRYRSWTAFLPIKLPRRKWNSENSWYKRSKFSSFYSTALYDI